MNFFRNCSSYRKLYIIQSVDLIEIYSFISDIFWYSIYLTKYKEK